MKMKFRFSCLVVFAALLAAALAPCAAWATVWDWNDALLDPSKIMDGDHIIIGPLASGTLIIPRDTGVSVEGEYIRPGGLMAFIESEGAITIKSGDTLTLDGSALGASENGEIRNNGVIKLINGAGIVPSLQGTLYNTGEITIDDSRVENYGTLCNTGGITINNDGYIENAGAFYNTGGITIITGSFRNGGTINTINDAALIKEIDNDYFVPFGGEAGEINLIPYPEIQGVTKPVAGEVPVAAVTETDEYTGTVTWSPAHEKFAANTKYTASITLTPKTFTPYPMTMNVPENYFTVEGADASNPRDSGEVTAVFPATGKGGRRGSRLFGCDAGFGALGALALLAGAAAVRGKKTKP